MWAAAVGDVTMIHTLIQKNGGGGLEIPDSHGLTAAFWAAQRGELRALSALQVCAEWLSSIFGLFDFFDDWCAL